MNKLNIKFVIPTCSLLILANCQVLSQNQHLYRFVINKKEQQAKFVLITLVKEELRDGEYEVKFKISSLLNLPAGINHYFLKEIYLDPLIFYFLDKDDGKFIQIKKNASEIK